MQDKVACSPLHASGNNAALPSRNARRLLRQVTVPDASRRARSWPSASSSTGAALGTPESSAHSAFPEALYEALAPSVYKLLWTLLGPDSERDDLAHEVFLKILKHAHQLRDPASLQAWATRLVVNTVKNEFRRRKLRRWLSLGTEDEREPSYHPDFEGREVLLRTYGILAKLPAHERLPLTLRLIGQQEAEEIAAVSGCSVRTVKRRLQAGRSRFLKLASVDPLLAERLQQAVPSTEDDDA